MGQRCQQRVTHLLAFADQPRLRLTLCQRAAFQRPGCQQDQSFQQPLLFGDQQLTAVIRLHNHHAVHFLCRADRQNLIRHAGQCAGAEPGGLAFVITPADDGIVTAVIRHPAPGRDQVTLLIRQQHFAAGMQAVADKVTTDRGDIIRFPRHRQRFRHFIQMPGALLTVTRHPSLITDTGSQAADHQPDGHHHREGKQILHIRDSQRAFRVDKKDIKADNVNNGGKHRWPAPVKPRHHHHAQDIEHYQVGVIKGHQPVMRHQGSDGTNQCRNNTTL